MLTDFGQMNYDIKDKNVQKIDRFEIDLFSVKKLK